MGTDGKAKTHLVTHSIAPSQPIQDISDGQIENVKVDLDGMQSITDFEVIKLEEAEPYLALVGIDWAFDNNAIINLKDRITNFESEKVKLTTPLDPTEGKRYID